MFLTSDTHFSCENTLTYRPFKTISEMNTVLINNWNKVVTEDSLVIHLGDFGDYKQVQHLNGRIILILGNHDIDYMHMYFEGNFKDFENYLQSLGFYKIIDESLKIDDMVLTHNPINCKKEDFNVFGHLHKIQMFNKFGINIGVDLFNYTPISKQTLDSYKIIYDNFKAKYDSLM